MKHLVDIGYQMAVKFPSCYPQQIHQLIRIAHSLETLDVRSCNYGLTEKDENRVTNLENKALEIAKEFGGLAYHQSDPRGCALYIVNPEELPKDTEHNNGYWVRQYYHRGVAIY